MQTDQYHPTRVPVSLLIAVDLEPTDAGVRRISGSVEEFSAERRNGSLEMVIRGEGPRILLDPKLRETIAKGHSDGAVEPRAAGAWLAHALAAEAGGTIQLSDPADPVLLIGVTLPAR